MLRVMTVLVLTLCCFNLALSVGSAQAAGPAAPPDLSTLGSMASKLPAPARANAQTWLDAIQKDSGHPNVVARRATELRAMLGILTAGEKPGTHEAWGALVATPADLLPVDLLNNVEVVEKGILIGGCEPADAAWDLLKSKGIKTVVNLRKETNDEDAIVKAHGMKAVYIPVVDQTAPTLDQARQFVKIVDDPANQPVYVHCHAGVGRTHTFIGAWRLAHGMSIDDTLAEGKTWGLSVSGQIKFLRSFTPGN